VARLRRPARILSLLACVVGLRAFPTVQPTYAAAPTCGPLYSWMDGIVSCYWPSQLKAAERRMPVTPVTPTGYPKDLSLTQVLVLSGTPSGGPGPAIAISYLYGIPVLSCATTGLYGAGCKQSTRYIIVQETVGHLGTRGIEVSYVAVGLPGPWHLSTDIPGRNLYLSIVSDTSRRVVTAVGEHILITATRHHDHSM
jgi:hypothetical protein